MLVFFYGTHLCLIKFALSLRPPIFFVGNFRLFLTCLFHLIVSHMICFYSSLLGLFWMLSHALLLRSKTCSDTNLRLNFRTFYTNDGMVTNSVCLFFFIQWTAIDYNGRGARLNISIQKILETRTERNILGCFSYYNFKILPTFRRSSHYSLFQNCSDRIAACTSQTEINYTTTEISRDRYQSNITWLLLSSLTHNIAGHPYTGFLNLYKN